MPLAVGTAAVVVAGLCGWLYWQSRTSIDSAQAEPERLHYGSVSVRIGGRDYDLQIADTPSKKSLGLGERNGLADGQGMIFTYRDITEPKCFWMKDMNFAIDIVWLDGESRVSHIEHSLSPASYPQTFCPDGGGKYVIELAAGVADSAGLKTGDKLEVML